MPYSSTHKRKVREEIVEAARILFNRHGFEVVTIDMIMGSVGLTRGGFYNHFKNKQQLYSEAVYSFLMGRGAKWREEAGIDFSCLEPKMAQQMIQSYLSSEHLGDIDGQCPMIALPSDVVRASPEVQSSYQKLLEAMVSLFEQSLGKQKKQVRQKALALSALCVGGMVLAKALPSSSLAMEVQSAASEMANDIIQA